MTIFLYILAYLIIAGGITFALARFMGINDLNDE